MNTVLERRDLAEDEEENSQVIAVLENFFLSQYTNSIKDFRSVSLSNLATDEWKLGEEEKRLARRHKFKLL